MKWGAKTAAPIPYKCVEHPFPRLLGPVEVLTENSLLGTNGFAEGVAATPTIGSAHVVRSEIQQYSETEMTVRPGATASAAVRSDAQPQGPAVPPQVVRSAASVRRSRSSSRPAAIVPPQRRRTASKLAPIRGRSRGPPPTVRAPFHRVADTPAHTGLYQALAPVSPAWGAPANIGWQTQRLPRGCGFTVGRLFDHCRNSPPAAPGRVEVVAVDPQLRSAVTHSMPLFRVSGHDAVVDVRRCTEQRAPRVTPTRVTPYRASPSVEVVVSPGMPVSFLGRRSITFSDRVLCASQEAAGAVPRGSRPLPVAEQPAGPCPDMVSVVRTESFGGGRPRDAGQPAPD